MIMFFKNFWSKNKKLIFYIIIPLLIGLLGFLLGGNTDIYSSIHKPLFSPPSFIFPIAWTILFILMGISAYIIANSSASPSDISKSLTVYYLQLVVNCLWSLFFFRLQWFLFSFIWILILIFLVLYMCYLFYKIDKKAAFLNIPYILWLCFASVLCFSVYWLNK